MSKRKNRKTDLGIVKKNLQHLQLHLMDYLTQTTEEKKTVIIKSVIHGAAATTTSAVLLMFKYQPSNATSSGSKDN